MKLNIGMRVMAGAACCAGLLAALGCGSSGGGDDSRLVRGQSQDMFGGTVSTWARVLPDNTITEAGVTVSLVTFQNARSRQAAGNMINVNFPDEVKANTFINYFSLGWEPQGHPPANIFTVPHFDLHFYDMSPDQVALIQPDNSLPRPNANRVPAGYLMAANDQDYMAQVVPQMGYHALPETFLAPGYVFDKVMVLGYNKGQMNFIEPMITRDYLLARQSFVMDVPRPAVLGRATRYPTRLRATYDPFQNSYSFVLSDFVNVNE
ncbi:MAG: cytochrome C [Armatimonadetes bacterium]|nr:cytochrome C [Armatimonadota bacterium]